MQEEKIRKEVREGYAKIAKEEPSSRPTTSCCGSSPTHEELSKKMGYTSEELNSIPKGSNLGLGCGNPVALASLKEGETVIDLGSGAGVDCFLAAKKVGEKGKVIGIDMTPEMLDKARENTRKGNYENVEFRLGEIEHLPVADNKADVVISNCVINLTSNKKKVYEEAFRVLKPGGRIMVSDLVLKKELSAAIREEAHPSSCIKTAIMKDKYLETIEEVGFKDIRILDERQYCSEELTNDSDAKVIIANRNTNAQELKSISELDEKSKKYVEEVLASTLSVNVSAIKP
ncbi:MAG: arsenite methyltransferase [Candidatus Bathyarchaeota archaeon]|nr:MAG: arsenite methyltransferase [Candidatus Bathyarchaeota archaeon]